MYEFHDPAARDVVGHVLDIDPEGPSLLAEAGHRRSLAGQSMRVVAEAFAKVKAARLGYEALRRRLDPRYGRTLHFGVALILLAAVAAALVALDGIEFAGVLFGWVAAAAVAAASAAWAGCAWLAALAVREERRGRVAVIAAGAAAAGLLLAALHGEASSIQSGAGLAPVRDRHPGDAVHLRLGRRGHRDHHPHGASVTAAGQAPVAPLMGRVPGRPASPPLRRRSGRCGDAGMVQSRRRPCGRLRRQPPSCRGSSRGGPGRRRPTQW